MKLDLYIYYLHRIDTYLPRITKTHLSQIKHIYTEYKVFTPNIMSSYICAVNELIYPEYKNTFTLNKNIYAECKVLLTPNDYKSHCD